MELHEKFSHHADKCLMVYGKQVDRDGQPIPIPAQGFKHGRIYQAIDDRNGLVEKIWLEDSDGKVLFEAKSKHTFEQVVYLRDTAFPNAFVHVYRGQHQSARRCDDPDWGKGYGVAGVTIYPPKCEIHTSKSKSKKSRKIKRAFK